MAKNNYNVSTLGLAGARGQFVSSQRHGKTKIATPAVRITPFNNSQKKINSTFKHPFFYAKSILQNAGMMPADKTHKSLSSQYLSAFLFTFFQVLKSIHPP